MLQYSVNKCVFSRRLKLSLPRSGSLKLSGRELQIDGPATEKDRGLSVLSRHRRTTKRRQVADRRCCRAEVSKLFIVPTSGKDEAAFFLLYCCNFQCVILWQNLQPICIAATNYAISFFRFFFH